MKAESYVLNNEERPKWLDMIPVKRYKHFTRFFKSTNTRGGGYYECFSNNEIDNYKQGKVARGAIEVKDV